MNKAHNTEQIERAAHDDFSNALEKVFAFAVVVGDHMQAGLVARGLTRARATVIWQLHRQGPSTQRQLARTIGVTARNITTLVDALHELGFVRRGPHPTDRRATLVTLTAAGAAVTGKLAEDYRAGAAYLFAGMQPQEVDQFLSTLDTLTARLAPISSAEE